MLAQELDKARFLEGSALFLSARGVREEFTSRYGRADRSCAYAAAGLASL
ncbi:hypothetical protein ACWDZ8_44035 [Streptomyces sp. NPDC003233]